MSDCGHVCCDERSDPFHGHFLASGDCPGCVLDHPGPRGRERVVPCATKTPEPHERGEFPMTCYACHVWADS